jgi:hypothetical protein
VNVAGAVVLAGIAGVLLYAAFAPQAPSRPSRRLRRRSGDFICKGFAVSFVMDDGRRVRAPASYGFLHDPSGRTFPSCVGLVAPFAKGGDEIDNAEARDYFGYDPRDGTIAPVPPRSLGAWRRVGRVEEILYTRRRPGRLPAKHRASYYHPIEAGTATLYRLGNLLRVELGSNCEWNARGIVRP